MSNSTASLPETASAVVSLGASQADIDALDDSALQDGLRLIREVDGQLAPYRLWIATAITRRSDHAFGNSGLARQNGFATPAVFIQSLTGTSLDDATKLARLGELMVDAEATATASHDEQGGSGSTAIATAAMSGGISLDAADAIRRGLGTPDDVVTAEQLRVEAEKLIAHANLPRILGVVTPEALLKLARQARARIDVDAVERGQKERADRRAVKIWEDDGMYCGSYRLTAEDGGAEINTSLKLLLAARTGGPRFPATDADGNPVVKSAAEVALEDPRSMDQVLADGFSQIFLNGLHVDPSVVPGAGRAPVRVVVTEKVLAERAGTALLEDNLSAITIAKLSEYLCEGGTVTVGFNVDGTIDVGREQRLFTRRQRTALGVRDGGCRFPGCNKPPSWCEAHHIDWWARDRGKTDIRNGMLLCRFHHTFVHEKGWEIIRGAGPDGIETLWLKPPARVDPDRVLIEMPTKNPIVAAMNYAASV
jgi:hypothetical protein